MTYASLQALMNDSYATFGSDYIIRELLGADAEYSRRQIYFVKTIYKVLLNQVGDITLDLLTKEEIQDIIVLYNKYSNSVIPIEYT
jgi:hypothetical protein